MSEYSGMKIMITGGAGFIGTNAASRFLSKGADVAVLDNMSRPGSRANVAHLEAISASKGGRLSIHETDVRNFEGVMQAVQTAEPDTILHLAAQVAVTTSVKDPRHDFEVNALGTFNALEAARLSRRPPLVIFASTNKVYGGMEEIGIARMPGVGRYESEGRYGYSELNEGISEQQLLDFHSPYGCSKGAADQYVRDYARIYGLRTAVARQSCIYGPRQFGIEDQGWVAWFIIAAVFGRPFHIFGDGLQVRDVLHVDDLVDAYESIIANRERMNGRIYNIGGGPRNSMSLLGLVRMLEASLGTTLGFDFRDWRPGDQPVYIGDISRANAELGWAPRIAPEEGVEQLIHWVRENRGLIQEQLGSLLG